MNERIRRPMAEPMSGLPDDKKTIAELKREFQAAVRGDDAWRHPDLVQPGEFGPNNPEPDGGHDESFQEWIDEGIEPVNMVAPTPPDYKHAHTFMAAVFGEGGYTPDSVGQLVDVFVPCLRIMCDREGHPWGPNGELWRSAGVLNLTGDVYKKHERFQYRLWTMGVMHKDSGFDLINFIAFCLRSDPDSRFGVRGEPAPPEATEAEYETGPE